MSNVNILIVLFLLMPFFSMPLLIIGNKSTHYKIKPRCLKYGKSFLFDIPFTILLFSSFCICTSFIVNIQYFGLDNTISFAVSLICLMILPIFTIIFIKFREKFN